MALWQPGLLLHTSWKDRRFPPDNFLVLRHPVYILLKGGNPRLLEGLTGPGRAGRVLALWYLVFLLWEGGNPPFSEALSGLPPTSYTLEGGNPPLLAGCPIPLANIAFSHLVYIFWKGSNSPLRRIVRSTANALALSHWYIYFGRATIHPS